MTNRIKPGELVPVVDRIRWLLLCRAGLTAAALAAGLFSAAAGSPGRWATVAVAWLGLNVLGVPIARFGRPAARFVLNAGMLGDGVLLGVAWWATGDLTGPVRYLVPIHAIAVTLLGSFRTGVKIAVWHSLIALVFLEAAAAGLVAPAGPVPHGGLWTYLGALWITVLGTASFAAMNERELRRRRYDAEVLREFGVAVAAAPEARAVAQSLARFAREELLARHAVVLAYVRDGSPDGEVRGMGAVAHGDGDPAVHDLATDLPRRSIVAAAVARRETVLCSRLHPADDPWLARVLPDARDLVVVPFALDSVAGALVMQVTTKGAVRQVERRAVNTAEQATAHAGIALERAVLTDRIHAAAQTDGLTGVANRRRFDEVLSAELARARSTGMPVALALIDIDHFKSVNDRHGHQVGDEVLRLVARTILTECGEPHLTARYGGEEFAAILIGADVAAAAAIAERVRAAIGVIETVAVVTASVGVAAYPTHGGRADDLIMAADAALYRAKAGGRDQVQVAGARRAGDLPPTARTAAPVH